MTFSATTALSVVAALWLIAPASAQDAAADGERQFRARCGTCHAVQPGQHRAGPSLAGVFGREAAKAEGARYSEAMRNAGIVWNAEQLDAYLASPRQVVPGTSMIYSLRDAAQRQAIIAYLRSLPAQAAGR